MSILKKVTPLYKGGSPTGEETANTSGVSATKKTSLSDLVEPDRRPRREPPRAPPAKAQQKKLRKKKPANKAQSGSPLLKRKFRVSVALSIPEYDVLHHAAQARHLSISALLRHAIFEGLGLPRPHPERPARVGQARALDGDT